MIVENLQLERMLANLKEENMKLNKTEISRKYTWDRYIRFVVILQNHFFNNMPSNNPYFF